MASRLTRWSAATVVTMVVMLVLALPPEGSVFEVLYDYRYRTATNPLDAAVTANARAIEQADYTLRFREAKRRFEPFMASKRSPIVVRHELSRSVIDEEMTATAESLWRTVTPAPDAPRTLLLASNDIGWSTWLAVARPDLCIGGMPLERRFRPVARGVANNAGGCVLATMYGPPGAGLAGWVDSVRTMEVPRAGTVMPGLLRTVLPYQRQWAESGDRDIHSDHFFLWTAPPVMLACAGGREEYCVASLGLGPEGLGATPSWRTSNMLTGRLLAVLHSELGPDRFREIWRSNDPLPVAYERATGVPFAPWAKRFVQSHMGRLEKDNALSLAGWLGWVLWMTLLMAWFATRVRGKEAL